FAAGRFSTLLHREFDDHRRVIRRLFALAWLAVDRAGPYGGGERGVAEDVVDPQAGVAPEAEHPVVPPGVLLRRLLQKAESVDQTVFEQRGETGAFLVGAVNLAGPFLWVVHVAVVRCDV